MQLFDSGDIIYTNFTPQSGHEQSGMRPALVVSSKNFMAKTHFTIICPITHSERNFPTHIQVPKGLAVDGYILCEQLKSLDYRARNWQFAETAPVDIFENVMFILDKIIGK